MPIPIPSLREQLLCVHVGGPAVISGDHYGLLMSMINKLEILAEKVEALEEQQELCCGECRFFNRTFACCKVCSGERRRTPDHEICDEFEALPPVVKAVEPSDIRIAEQYNTVIRNLCKELAEAKAECGRLCKENDKAKATIERLREKRGEREDLLTTRRRVILRLYRRRNELCKELAESKATIENLRKEYDVAKDDHEAYKEEARNRIYTLRKERDEAEAAIAKDLEHTIMWRNRWSLALEERDRAEAQIKELENHILRMMHKEAG